MRFIVYGAGGVGSTIGGHLFRTGHAVVLVGNPLHIDKIRESGLRLVTPGKTYRLKICACKNAEELKPFSGDDVVLLTAKSQHTLLCLSQLKKAAGVTDLPIFCCQNSIANEPLATRIFSRVYGALIRIPSLFLEPGVVVNDTRRIANFVEVGLYPRGSDRLALAVSAALTEAGMRGGVNDRVMETKATKCLINLSNALNAITDRKGDSRSLFDQTEREAKAVWRTAGIEWEDRSHFETRTRFRGNVGRMPKEYQHEIHPDSSWQSLVRGTGNIEAEKLNGDVVQLGRQLGIATPFNEVLWQVAEEMARNKEKPGKYTVEELMKMVAKRKESSD